MPSSRHTASGLEIDQRMVAKACRRLESDGIVELRTFLGAFVWAG